MHWANYCPKILFTSNVDNSTVILLLFKKRFIHSQCEILFPNGEITEFSAGILPPCVPKGLRMTSAWKPLWSRHPFKAQWMNLLLIFTKKNQLKCYNCAGFDDASQNCPSDFFLLFRALLIGTFEQLVVFCSYNGIKSRKKAFKRVFWAIHFSAGAIFRKRHQNQHNCRPVFTVLSPKCSSDFLSYVLVHCLSRYY
jgi:hypothetical protein